MVAIHTDSKLGSIIACYMTCHVPASLMIISVISMIINNVPNTNNRKSSGEKIHNTTVIRYTLHAAVTVGLNYHHCFYKLQVAIPTRQENRKCPRVCRRRPRRNGISCVCTSFSRVLSC